MKIGHRGLKIIKDFEGFQAKAYKCPAGVMTIGYGTTKINNKKVKSTDVVTEAVASELLEDHLACEVYPVIEKYVKTKLSQNQFDALCSFIYNIGGEAFRKSTMLRLINVGLMKEAANEFPRWNKAGGKVLNGLVRRRDAEQKLFSAVFPFAT